MLKVLPKSSYSILFISSPVYLTLPCLLIGPPQVEETVDWLCEYFQRCRLSKSDLRSFGLYSAWAPYVSEVTTFWGYLIGYLIDLQLNACAREPLGGARVLKGTRHSFH